MEIDVIILRAEFTRIGIASTGVSGERIPPEGAANDLQDMPIYHSGSLPGNVP
jgi:hypothetical protein